MHLESKKKIDLVIGGFGISILKPFVILLGKILKRNHQLESTGNILVLKLLGGGSLLLAYPSLLALKKKLSRNQNLILITTKEIFPFAEEMKIFDVIHVINDSSFFALAVSSLTIMLKMIGRIDTCIDLEVHSRGTAILSLVCGARNRLGFYKESIYWRIGIYTHLVFYNTYSLSSSFYDALISLLGVKAMSFDEATEQFKKNQTQQEDKNIIALGFSCSNNAVERRLNAKQWGLAIKNLDFDRTAQVVLLGGAKDHVFGESIKNEIESVAKVSCLNHCGQTSLKEAIEQISAAKMFLGIDSGLLHIARLLGKDTVSYWGPTDPYTRLAPRQRAKDTVHYQKTSCSPCVHFANNPPCQGENKCIQALFEPKIKEKQITWLVMPEAPKPVLLESTST